MMAFRHSEPARGGQRTEHQFRELARLSFGMPKNVGRAAIAPEKPRSTPTGGGNPLPMVADCEMPN
ncbi:hypothetical protein HCH02_10450 [Parabacteroides merdae]|uniref:Uncharacterized protein n=2 Tax=Bacteroidales TaxID=171549 RepID=A0A8B2YV31_BACUN|nr:hypothetical protein [Parabacteroides merdae]RGJ96838.1 hypothetical protein DXD40_00010 [Bacteroides uniformis]RGZ27525.1 hypothetical protein DW998_00980 [Parabacteroides distasonis]